MSEPDKQDDADLRAQRRLGQVLRGKYRLDRVLGVGGMAAVYAATHRNQKHFAVKLLHPELSLREDIRTRFLREGYAANSVRHAGAVNVLDDDVAEDGAAFLVMELLDGLSVEQLAAMKGDRLAVAYVLGIAHQLLDTLAAAHAQGIVHRDIKPANLFVSREGQVKVLDFGIARVRDAATSGAHATGTGTLLGTPGFMAPEQALGKSNEIDGQTDLWAVGATLFTLLTGQLVHEGETGPHLMVLAATTPARPVVTLAPEIHPPLASIVDRALAFRKGDRWSSAEAMRDAVRDASLAIFRRLPLRETLLPMFDDRPDPLAQTRQAEGRPQTGLRPGGVVPSHDPSAPVVAPGGAAEDRGVLAVMPPAQTGPGQPWPAGGRGPGLGAGVGLTTSQPVSNDAPVSLPAGLPRTRPGVLGIVMAAGAIVVVGGTAVSLHLIAGHSSAAVLAPLAGPSPSAAPARSSPAAALVAPPVPLAEAALAADPSASSPMPPTPVPSAAPAGSAPRSAAAPAASVKSHPAPAIATSPTASAPAPAPVCRLVSSFDADGNKHFRQECH